jgi:1-acyl-sn-glycerol-3-phosphate acyltransferase
MSHPSGCIGTPSMAGRAVRHHLRCDMSDTSVHHRLERVAVVTSKDQPWARRLPARFVRVVLHLIGLVVLGVLVGRPRVSGADRLRRRPGPLVLAANHSSHLDTPYLLSCLPLRHRHRTLVMAASDYFYDNMAKAALVSLAFGTVPVERTDDAADSTALVHRLLDEGWNILLFPEGTRSRTGRMASLHKGAALLAEVHHVDLVPVGLHGTHDALPPGSWWPRRRRITVRIGEPLPRSGDVEERTAELERRLRELSGQRT